MRNVLFLLLLCFLPLLNAQEVKIESSSTRDFYMYLNGKPGSELYFIEVYPMDEKLLQLTKDMEKIYNETLKDYLTLPDYGFVIGIEFNSQGDYFYIRTSMNKDLKNNLSKDQFRYFAQRIEKEIKILNYFVFPKQPDRLYKSNYSLLLFNKKRANKAK